MKKNYTFSLESEVVETIRLHAGPVPLSRFVELLLKKEVSRVVR